jgi:cytochrome c oxidase cbb3-type subunit 3
MRRGWAWAAAVLALAGCRLADGPPAASSGAARLEAGRAVYNYRCYFCHGYAGDAKTLAASYLVPPPRDFTRATPGELDRARVRAALREGRPGTAMKSFQGVLSAEEMAAVADFVVAEFVAAKRPNTRYHTAENGWPQHERYRAAYPFARGELSLNTPWEELSPEQAAGKRLYLASCVSCHDRGRAEPEGIAWEARALSYPRNQYSHTAPASRLDAVTSASPYLLHEVAPKMAGMTARERAGEKLFQDNCAFCHGADGTGRNWIGSFLEPHPRDLTDPSVMNTMTPGRLAQAIREGLPGTSMPAWKSVLAPGEIDALTAYIGKAFHPLAKD